MSTKFPPGTQALIDCGFRRAMVTKYDGTCEWCGKGTAAGSDFAAVNRQGKWKATCATCAASVTAMAGGLVTRIAASQDSLTDEQVASIILPERLADVLAGTADTPTAVSTVAGLWKVAQQVEKLTRVEDARIVALRHVTPSAGFESDFIPSVLGQYEDRGSLSPRQWQIVERILADKARGDVPTPEVGTTWKSGDDVIIIRTTKRGQPVGYILSDDGEWQYGGKAALRAAGAGEEVAASWVANEVCLRKYGAPLGSEELRRMAAQYGTTHGTCMFCALPLTHADSDPALGGAGYGGKCAENYGLPHGQYSNRRQA